MNRPSTPARAIAYASVSTDPRQRFATVCDQVGGALAVGWGDLALLLLVIWFVIGVMR